MAAYSSREILELAMQLEDSGRMFYEAVAAGCPDVDVAELCRRLAWYEESHFQKFLAIRDGLAPADAPVHLPAAEARWLHAFTGRQVIPGREEAENLACRGTPADILDLALRAEREAIDFYIRVCELVGSEDRAAVERIIAEEREHLRTIESARRTLREAADPSKTRGIPIE